LGFKIEGVLGELKVRGSGEREEGFTGEGYKSNLLHLGELEIVGKK